MGFKEYSILKSVEDISSEDIIIARETELIIDLVVKNMPEQRRKVFEMSRTEGLSNEEIAVALSISRRMVEKHLALAKKEINNIILTLLLLLVFLF